MTRPPAFKCDICGERATNAVDGTLGDKPMTFTTCDEHKEFFT